MTEGATVELLMDDADRNGQPVLKGERGVVKSVSRDFLIVEFSGGRLAEIQEILLSPIYTPDETQTFGQRLVQSAKEARAIARGENEGER